MVAVRVPSPALWNQSFQQLLESWGFSLLLVGREEPNGHDQAERDSEPNPNGLRVGFNPPSGRRKPRPKLTRGEGLVPGALNRNAEVMGHCCDIVHWEVLTGNPDQRVAIPIQGQDPTGHRPPRLGHGTNENSGHLTPGDGAAGHKQS